MKRRLVAATLSLLLLFTLLPAGAVSVSAATYTESEDNNSINTANTITFGNTTKGTISSGADNDYYKFTVTQNGHVQLLFTNALLTDGNARWSVLVYKLDNSLTEIHNHTVYATNASTTLPKIGVTPGTYYVKIASAYYERVNNVEYGVELNFTATNCWESETNEDYASADTVSFGQTYGGFIRHDNDVDYYKFTVTQNGHVQLLFTNPMLTDGSAKWSVLVYKLDNTLTEIHNHTVYATSASTTLPKIGVTPGTYYVKIASAYYGHVNNVEYGVKLSFTATNYWESEINEDYASADTVSFGQTYGGFIRHDNDVDYYKFTVTQNGHVQLLFTNPMLTHGSAKWSVLVYKYDDSLTEIHSHTVYATNTSTTLPKIGVTPGTYYVKIASAYYGHVNNVEYGVKLNFVATNYWESETNEEYSSADEITIGQAYSGYIRYDGDRDFYKIEFNGSQTVDIRFNNDVSTQGRWRITIYKLENSLIEMDSFIAYPTDAQTTKSDVAITAGTYYIRVTSDYYGYVNNLHYSITVTGEDAVRPSASITATNSLASSQTATLSMSDNVGVVSYYWGTSGSPSSSSYTSVSSSTSKTVTKTVSSAGTYYLFVKDAAGNTTSTSMTFYKTTFNTNGGGSVSPSYSINKSGSSITLSMKPTRTNYTFLGWSTSSSATTASYAAGSGLYVNANRTLYAVWQKNPTTSTVYYNGNGGSGIPNPQTKIPGTPLTLSSQVPKRSGYAFVGWATSSTATKAAYQPGDQFKNNTNTTLFAVWQKGAYRIAFNANGGTNAPAAQMKVPGTPLTISSQIPKRSGYAFLGWATSASAQSATYQPYDAFKNNCTTTLYAVWKAGVYRVSYDANGGSGVPSAQFKVPGTPLTLSKQKPTREGYRFLGWSTDKSATAGTYATGAQFKNNTNTVLYAVWQRNRYTITFNANGGTGAPSAQTKIHGLPLTLSSQKPTRSGYKFLGWSTNKYAKSGTYASGGQFKISKTTTLYAVWKANGATLNVGGSYNATISTAGSMAYYTFTPSTSGSYVIYSTSSTDTQVYLYNASGAQLAYNDDGGESLNFRLTYSLQAGKTYKYGIRYYDSSRTGSIPFVFAKA